MTTTNRQHSVHIQAPVQVVFKRIEDPVTLWGGAVDVSDVQMTPSGIGTTWKWSTPMMGLHVTGTMTRTDQVVEERIVEESSTGPVWTWTLAPGHHDDTVLTLQMEYSTQVPLLDKAVMLTVGRHTDEEMQRWLTAVKMTLES